MTGSLRAPSSHSSVFIALCTVLLDMNDVIPQYPTTGSTGGKEKTVTFNILSPPFIPFSSDTMSKLGESSIMTNGDLYNSKRRSSLNAEYPLDLQQSGMINGHSKTEQKSNGKSFHTPNGINQNGGFGGLRVSDDNKATNNVNNAITNAPSRHAFIEPNVYAGGRTIGHPKRQKKHRRSKTPDFKKQTSPQFDSILSRLDCSIRTQFGDWNDEDEMDSGLHKLSRNNVRNTQPAPAQKHTLRDTRDDTYYGSSRISPVIPPPPPIHQSNSHSHSNGMQGNNGDNFLSLPRLFKPYDNVMKSNKLMVNDPIYQLSKDNHDPNSILSQAKRTLTQVGAEIAGPSNHLTADFHNSR